MTPPRRAATAGPRPDAGRNRPNPILLVVLALVAVAAVGRLAIGSLAGGSTMHSFAPIVVPRTLARKAAVPPAGGSQAVLIGRSPRDPFAPAPGFAR
ncbi:MAG: hypothetical protein NVSMB12_20400 [Acidimicrobiales bacterium]